MRQSVIGIFEMRKDALRARDAVGAMGIGDVELNLMPADDVGERKLSGEELDRYEDAIDVLFGEGADESAELYMDALRQGHTLLTVTVDDAADVGRVREAMQRHNASDVAEDEPVAGDQHTPAEKAQDTAKGE